MMELFLLEHKKLWRNWQSINSWLETLYPKLRDTGKDKTMICYVDPEKLTGFYERRQKAVQDFLENSGQTGAEKEYLLQMDAEVKEPYRYGWVKGWSPYLLITVPVLIGLLCMPLAIN